VAESNGVLTSPTLLAGLGDPNRREEAWRIFLERYRPLISGWCRRLGLNAADAEDVTGAVLAKLVLALPTFVYDPGLRFRAWLWTVVDHEACDLWRWQARHPADRGVGDCRSRRNLEESEAASAVDDLVRELDETLERDLRLARQIAASVRKRVEPATWQAFWQTAMENRTPRDVAARLGMNVSAVYMAKSRVARMLRDEGARLRSADSGGAK
jgi:RNA polymerase sigma-70 factor (ECF subfamily)